MNPANTETIDSHSTTTTNSPSISTAERVRSGVKWGTIARVVQILGQLLANMALARLLVRADFGLVNMSAVFLAIANSFADFGVRTYVVQSKELTDDQWKSAQLFSWFVGLSIFFAGVIAAIPLSRFYNEPKLIQVLTVQSLIYVIASATSVHTALITRKLDFRRSALIEVAANLTYPVVAVLLALAGAAYWSLVLGRLASALVGLRLVVPSWKDAIPSWVPWQQLKPIFRFGTLLTISSALTQLDENFDNIIVGKVFGRDALGVYATAYNTAALPQRYIGFMLAGIAMPIIARAANKLELQKGCEQVVRYQMLIPVAVAMGFAVMSRDVCLVLLGSKWPDAPPLVQVMSVSAASLSVGTAIGGILLSQGKAQALLIFTIAKLFVLVAGVLAGLRFGPWGVATGFATANVITILGGLSYTGYIAEIGASRLLIALIRPAIAVSIATVVTWLLARWIVPWHVPAIVHLAIVGSGTAIALAVGIKLFCPTEWGHIQQSMQRLVRRGKAA